MLMMIHCGMVRSGIVSWGFHSQIDPDPSLPCTSLGNIQEQHGV